MCVTSGVMLSRISTWSAPGAKFTRCTDWPGLVLRGVCWGVCCGVCCDGVAPGDSHGHRVGGVASRRRDVDPVAAVLRQRPGPRGPLRRCGHGRAVGGEHVERAVPLHRGDRHVHQLAGARRQVPPIGGAEQHRPADGAGVGTRGERQCAAAARCSGAPRRRSTRRGRSRPCRRCWPPPPSSRRSPAARPARTSRPRACSTTRLPAPDGPA